MTDAKRYRMDTMYPTFTSAETTRIVEALRASIGRWMARETVRQQVNGGGIIGECAKWALKTAKALEYAQWHDWRFVWEEDTDADFSFVETHDAKYQEEWNSTEHKAECCQLWDADDNLLASLGGIIDADDNYRRVIEGELALEAIPCR